MNKMTDTEIIKALECCKNDDCDNCPNAFVNCYSNLAGYSLDLINRLQARVEKCEKVERFADKTIATQKAEIERLNKCRKEEVEKLMFETDKVITEAKVEAVKEFAEIVKANKRKLFNYIYSSKGFDEQIDNLVKEMTEQ